MAIDVGTAIAYLNLDSTNFNQGLNASLSALEEFERKGATVGSAITNVGQIATNAGYSLTKNLTVPLVNFGQSSIQAYRDYESAFAGVKKTIDDNDLAKYNVTYEQLSESIQSMATETASSAEEIAAVMEMAGQLGIPLGNAGEDITKFTKTMVMLGDSTNVTADEAALSLAKFMNITGTAASDSDRLGSAVVDLGNKFATQEDQIINMSTRLASAGTIAGLTEQEILALATAMSSVGIRAEAGGSAMATTLNQIEKITRGVAGKDMEESVAMMEELARVSGMTADEFKTMWQNNPLEALTLFINGLGQLEEQGDSAVVSLDKLKMSGVRQSNMLKALALSTENLDYALEVSNGAWDENTALVVEANKRYETMDSRISQLNERWKILKRDIAELLIPVLEKLMDIIEKVIDKWNSLSDGEKQTIVRIAEIVAAVGPLLLIFGKLVTTVGTIVKIFESLSRLNMLGMCHKMGQCAEGTAASIGKVGTSIGAVIKIAAGIAALVGGLILAGKNFFDMWSNGFDWLKEAFMVLGLAIAAVGAIILGVPAAIAAAVAAAIAIIATAAILIHEHWDEIKAWWKDLVDGIKEKWHNFWDNAHEKVAQMKEKISNKWEEMKKDWSDKVDSLKEKWHNFWDDTKNKTDEAKNAIVNGVEEMKESVSSKWEEMKQRVSQTWEDTKRDIIQKTQEMKDNVSNKINELKEDFKNKIEEMKKSISEKFQQMKDDASKTINDMKQDITNKINELKENTSQKINELKEDAISKFNEMKDRVVDKIQELKEKAHQKIEEMKTSIGNTVANMKQNFVNKIEEMKNEVTRKFNDMKDEMIRRAEELKNTVRDKFEEMKNEAKQRMEAFRDTVEELGNRIREKFDSIRDSISNIVHNFRQIGSDLINSLWQGLKDAWHSVESWFSEKFSWVSNIISGIKGAVSGISSRFNGSHANGLDYVPFDGYIAQLHEGERVLTKEENKDYNNNNGSSGGDTFNFYNTKPDPYEYARQMKRAKKELAYT